MYSFFEDVQVSLVDIWGSFVDMQGSFMDVQGSFADTQGSSANMYGFRCCWSLWFMYMGSVPDVLPPPPPNPPKIHTQFDSNDFGVIFVLGEKDQVRENKELRILFPPNEPYKSAKWALYLICLRGEKDQV